MTGRVVRGVGTRDAAATRVTAGQGIEVEPRVAGDGQTAATCGAGHGTLGTGSNGEGSAEFRF